MKYKAKPEKKKGLLVLKDKFFDLGTISFDFAFDDEDGVFSLRLFF